MEQTIEDWYCKISEEIKSCTKCPLCKNRKQAVVGNGSLKPDYMFIGEAPGQDEDDNGIPFIGRSGKLLRKYINKYGLMRFSYITNVCKCHPIGNRHPEQNEIDACLGYLHKEIIELNPKLLILAGATAYGAFRSFSSFSSIVNEMTKIRVEGTEFDAIPIFHPSYLLRNMVMIPSYDKGFAVIAKDFNVESSISKFFK